MSTTVFRGKGILQFKDKDVLFMYRDNTLPVSFGLIIWTLSKKTPSRMYFTVTYNT